MSSDDAQRWHWMLAADDGDIQLAEGALMIARDEYPDLDIDAYLQRLDTLADRVAADTGGEVDVVSGIKALNRCLFEDERYEGNRVAYYDARNSYLNDVMDRRLGIPITLSTIYIEVAGRLDLPVVGVNFPGHFMVKWQTDQGDIVIDPFSKGECLGIEQLDRLLRGVYGDGAPTVRERPEVLAAASKKHVLVRMLRNLKRVYCEQNDSDRTLRAMDRILALDPRAHQELRERAALYEKRECFRAAMRDLESYRAVAGAGSHAREPDDVEESLRRLRTRVSSYH